MSALFGHRKSAFTGAMAERPGLLRAADTGTPSLDEIGEPGLDGQAMILRAIRSDLAAVVRLVRPLTDGFPVSTLETWAALTDLILRYLGFNTRVIYSLCAYRSGNSEFAGTLGPRRSLVPWPSVPS